MSAIKTAVSANARKFQVAALGFIAAVVAALRDGHLSAGDKWEIAAAAIVALGVFGVPNKTAAALPPADAE